MKTRDAKHKASFAHRHLHDQSGEADVEPLTWRQIRELRRRIADMDDPTRYLLVSEFTPRFALYYNVSDDTFAMNEPKGGTLFKRRQAAVAVKRLLRSGIRVVRCTTKRKDGMLVPVLPKRSGRVGRTRK